MTMTVVRIPLTLATALAFHISMSPPTDPAQSTAYLHEPGDKCAIRAVARFTAATLTKGLYWASTLTEALVLLAPYLPTRLPSSLPISIPTADTLLSWVRPATSGLGLDLNLSSSLSLPLHFPSLLLHLPPLPLAAIAGTTLALAGALVRLAAYRALGQFYPCPNPGPGSCRKFTPPRRTPQANANDRLRPRNLPSSSSATGHAHALITTGPFAFVRHPGYAGLALCTTGLVVIHLDALGVLSSSSFSGVGEGVVRAASLGEGAGLKMRTVALVCAILTTVGAIWRIRDEERALKAHFKGEWEAWAERVRYRLLPGVY